MRRSPDWANLDVLRAVAVLLVLFAHVAVFFGFADQGRLNPRALGILGVLFFFVHTSLVLMLSLERQVARSGRRRMFAVFITRRAFRIYPLCLFALLAICVFRIPSSSLGHGTLRFAPPDILGFVSNALLAQNLVGRPSVLGVMWSLPYEMQMYLFLPALFLLAGRARTVWTLALLWVGAFALAMMQQRVGHLPDLLLYVPCFVPGIMAYYLSSRVRATLPFAVFPAFLALLAVAYMYAWSPGAAGIVPGMFVCLALGVLLPRFVEVRNARVRRAGHLIARYSYGIYIAHYFALWVAFMVLAGAPAVVRALTFVALAVAVPVALFHAVEAPMISVGNRVAARFATRPSAPPEAVAEPVAAG